MKLINQLHIYVSISFSIPRKEGTVMHWLGTTPVPTLKWQSVVSSENPTSTLTQVLDSTRVRHLPRLHSSECIQQMPAPVQAECGYSFCQRYTLCPPSMGQPNCTCAANAFSKFYLPHSTSTFHMIIIIQKSSSCQYIDKDQVLPFVIPFKTLPRGRKIHN